MRRSKELKRKESDAKKKWDEEASRTTVWDNRNADSLILLWLVLCAAAHLHGSLPILAAQTLGKIADAQSEGDEATVKGLLAASPVLQAYRQWCATDQRYCMHNECVMVFQGITAVYATPMCLWLVWAIRTRHPARHVVQALLCFGQLYGTLIYFGTAAVNDWRAINPDPFHFWGLFVCLNGLWVIFPLIMLKQSCDHCKKALDLWEIMKAA